MRSEEDIRTRINQIEAGLIFTDELLSSIEKEPIKILKWVLNEE